MGGTPRTVAVAVGMEDRLQLLLQQHGCCGLGHPVGRVRHPEGPDSLPHDLSVSPPPAPAPACNFPRTSGSTACRGCSSLAGEPGDADGVHTGRPLVGPDLLPRLEHETLRNVKRLHLQSWSLRRLLPHWGWPLVDLALPGPLAPAPLQGLHRYYGPVRPCAPHRYSAPRGVRRLRSSLSRPGGRQHPFRLAVTIGTTGSPVPCQRLRRAHATFTPGTAEATCRPLPG